MCGNGVAKGVEDAIASQSNALSITIAPAIVTSQTIPSGARDAIGQGAARGTTQTSPAHSIQIRRPSRYRAAMRKRGPKGRRRQSYQDGNDSYTGHGIPLIARRGSG